jgi:carbamoyl-phosphate synthase small subunit
VNLRHPALLVLEEGTVFTGIAFGHYGEKPSYAIGEVVFNTAMTGYQEILTDPSYADQLITLTFPQIGNVGTNPEDAESDRIYAKGLIIRQYPYQLSNWRATSTLSDFLTQQGVLGIAEIDTRQLTRIIREKGALKGCILSAPVITDHMKQEALAKAINWSGLKGKDLAQQVSVSSSYVWQSKLPHCFHVVALDFGIKKSILRCLDAVGCKVTVVPARTSAKEVLALRPDGVFLSNGPGDPAPCDYAIEAIKIFLEHNLPLFGICLGHQLLALACGANTEKMRLGHHGANHPVKCLKTNRVLITSQNHGFAVEEGYPSTLEVTHRSLFDNSIQGFLHKEKRAFGFQGHPEAGPGPNEARVLFSHFVHLMQLAAKEKQNISSPLLVETN